MDLDLETGLGLDLSRPGALEGGFGAFRGRSGWIEWNPDPLTGSGLDIIFRCKKYKIARVKVLHFYSFIIPDFLILFFSNKLILYVFFNINLPSHIVLY